MSPAQGFLFDDDDNPPPSAPPPAPATPPIQPPRVGMHDYTPEDLARLNTCKARVLAFCLRGEWFTNMQLCEAIGAIDAAKRRRELEHVDGFRFAKRKIGEKNVLEFRLLADDEPDPEPADHEHERGNGG